jgi:hypothetical protein
MLDFIFTIGQVAAAMLVLYGAMLVMPLQRKSPNVTSAREDELLLLKHLRNDA